MKTISYERVVSGPDTLRLYLKDISRFPQLTPEEEKELGARVQKGDEEAFRKLIESNLRFVVAMAKKYSRSGYPLHELINEGNMGLIEAASRFDPTRGVRFITYASWWIRQAILAAISHYGCGDQTASWALPMMAFCEIRRTPPLPVLPRFSIRTAASKPQRSGPAVSLET